MAHTFNQLAAARIERGLTAESTRARYRGLLRHAAPWLGHLHARRVTTSDVERCLHEVSGCYSPSTLRLLLGFVRAVLGEVGNPAAQAVRVRVPDTNHVTLGRDDTLRLRAALEALDSPAADLAIVLLETGLRAGEGLALRDYDVDAGGRQLVVRKSKSGKARRVDLSEYMGTRLAFRGVPRSPGREAVRRAVHRACEAAGLPRIRVHDLRHGRATRLLLKGVPALYVANQLGHSSVSFTLARYGHVSVAPEAQRREWANA